MHNRPPPLFVGALLLTLTTQTDAAFGNHCRKPRSKYSCRLYSNKCDIGVGVMDGSDPERPQKQNQDASFVVSLDDDAFECWGVMDGHGTKGHVVTGFLKEELPSILKEELESRESLHDDKDSLMEFEKQLETLANATPSNTANPIHSRLVRTFHRAHLAALQNPNVPAGRSGTTCIVCLLQQPKFTLHVAYVGDSRAILWNDKDDIATIAEETTTKTPSELDRIQQCQGRVDASGNVFHGPVGIAMTRALGDAVMLRAGVIPTPIVKTYNVNTNTRIVVATDGVFDVLTNNQVRQVVDEAISKGGDCEAAANVLAETAKQKWLGGLPIESKVDDITCIVVSL